MQTLRQQIEHLAYQAGYNDAHAFLDKRTDPEYDAYTWTKEARVSWHAWRNRQTASYWTKSRLYAYSEDYLRSYIDGVYECFVEGECAHSEYTHHVWQEECYWDDFIQMRCIHCDITQCLEEWMAKRFIRSFFREV